LAIVDIFAEVEEIKQDLENLSVDELKDEISGNSGLLLIDIREIQELIELGTIPGAVHVARGMMEFWASPASPYYRDYF
jgi:rhodanese-related sulfurtransferase